MRRIHRLTGALLFWLTAALPATAAAPLGQLFPDVRGTSLAGVPKRLPQDLLGSPTLLLIGFKMKSQFDIDRWILGLEQAGVKVTTYELPTIKGLLPRLVSGTIDGGMRQGIPEEDWVGVITVYGDAGTIARFTGDKPGLPARVVLLDATGRVVFFHDQGYSVKRLLELKAILDGLGEARG